jgi:hypothetical protein
MYSQISLILSTKRQYIDVILPDLSLSQLGIFHLERACSP